MGDERDQDVLRAPLWPPDPEPERAAPRPQAPGEAAPQTPPMTPHPWDHQERWDHAAALPYPQMPPQIAQEPQPPSAPASAAQHPWQAAGAPWEGQQPTPTISDEPTMRVSAVPAPPTPSISEAQTMRVSVAPALPDPLTPADAPAQPRPTGAPFAPAHRLEAADAPTPTYTAPPPAAPPPVATPTPERKGLSLAWRLALTLIICLLLLAGAGGLYLYAASLAAAPQQVMANYCAALKRDDYHAAYRLLSSTAQGQETEAQYLADATARDTIEGPVTQCAATATENLSPLSFLRSPRSLLFGAQITRRQAASGQIALTRDAVGWHVAALSSSLQGVDLGPLYTEQALCKAFGQRTYDQAYALLSTPYQKEQGDAATFARAFGATLTVSGCSPDLKSYSVNSADQQATLNATLTVGVAATPDSPAGSFTLPAKLTFVREATGWRVDAITPLLNQ